MCCHCRNSLRCHLKTLSSCEQLNDKKIPPFLVKSVSTRSSVKLLRLRCFSLPDDNGIVYSCANIGLGLIARDFYGYVSHRALHTRYLYRFHKTHHEDAKSTVWTAYHFHPIEAVVQYSCLALLSVILPVGLTDLSVLLKLDMAYNMYAHAYVGRHTAHHCEPTTNFALYFSIWDRVCNTHIDPLFLRKRRASPRRIRERSRRASMLMRY